MAQEPRVLLLDEPTSFLDPGRESGMRRLLSRICRERGLAVLSVTHDLNLAVLTGDRVMALKNGRVAFLGCRGTFADNRVLEDLFDTSFLFASHPQTGDAVFIPESIS
jgi:iron complex transport system ATP-binding protein